MAVELNVYYLAKSTWLSWCQWISVGALVVAVLLWATLSFAKDASSLLLIFMKLLINPPKVTGYFQGHLPCLLASLCPSRLIWQDSYDSMIPKRLAVLPACYFSTDFWLNQPISITWDRHPDLQGHGMGMWRREDSTCCREDWRSSPRQCFLGMFCISSPARQKAEHTDALARGEILQQGVLGVVLFVSTIISSPPNWSLEASFHVLIVNH